MLSDSKNQKQRSVVITYENAVVYGDVGACSAMFKLPANRLLICEFHAQKGCYCSLLPVCIFTLNTANVILGICSVVKVHIAVRSVRTQVRGSSSYLKKITKDKG